MTRISERDARCRVYTFKEGILSAVAHDLEIEVSRFWVEWNEDASTLEAELDARSLHVLHPMADGRPNPGALSERDRRKIEQTIVEDVLHASRHPAICFRAKLAWSGGVPSVDGDLTLTGRTRPVRVEVRLEGAELVARATLHQPDFGITPYSAMLGTLKIKPDVRVELSVPSSQRPASRAS